MNNLFNTLAAYAKQPELYAPSTSKFWDDEHISKGMLDAHLNPSVDAATRKPAFVDQSVEWISAIAPPAQFSQLLDLGCGPGLYAERFSQKGYTVTGIDLSRRSIEYAQQQARANGSSITYKCLNYLTLDDQDAFDIATLIYCDYGALSTDDRRTLLQNIHRALKPGGKLLLDVFTPAAYVSRTVGQAWQSHPEGGFWSEHPHLCLSSVYHYDMHLTELRQEIVITDESVQCYNIWEHFFTRDAFLSELQAAGFSSPQLFGDIAGATYTSSGQTMCGVCTK